MKKFLCTLGILALAATGASADVKVETEPGSPIGIDAVCPPSGDYKVYTDTGFYTLPDVPGAIVGIGPIDVPSDGTTITDVVVSANISHTWAGDVYLALGLDSDENGSIDASAELLCRTGLAGCDPFTGCCGCSADLPGGMSWGAGSPFSVDAICLSGVIAPGCYLPDPESAGLGVFNGLSKEGDWYLLYCDGAGGDTGSLSGWSVAFLNDGGIATEPTTWSAVKAVYR
jgi:hypothetical protein